MSSIAIQFSIPVDHPFTLRGKLDSSHVGQSSGGVFFLMTWFDSSTGQMENYLRQSSSSSTGQDGEVALAEDGVITANTQVTIQITAGASVPQPAEGSMLADAFFEFDFDLGDSDVIFTDDAEYGDTSGWTLAFPENP